MNKKVFMKVFPFLFMLLTVGTSSCKNDNENDFKAGRDVFIGKNNIRIVFPAERDTINFRDTTSGVTMAIKRQELMTMTYELKDTITFRYKGDTIKVKEDIKIVLKYKNFHILDAMNGKGDFGFEGTALLYLNTYKQSKIDTIPLKYIPSIGYIDGNKMYYGEEFIPDSNFTEPYIMVRYTGYRQD